MTSFQKLCLGPGRTRACKSCGTRVSVPWASVRQTWPLIGGSFGAFGFALVGEPLARWLSIGGKWGVVVGVLLIMVIPVALLITGIAWGSMRM